MSETLESEENLAFLRRWWGYERIGWLAMMLFVTVGFAGGFGLGPLSRTDATSPDGRLRCEYDRIARQHAPTQIDCTLSTAPESEVTIHLAQSYVQQVRVEEINPEPLLVKPLATETAYRFAALPGQDSITISFHLKPQFAGNLPLHLRFGKSVLKLSQTICP